ncbi:MAG TPA: BMP family ABC transporter substrate-binding protein [bacterium]|jgi:basic membrane protein A|nr:BMP family ABC transporter substrate-binding protein [bacterium]
MRLMMNRIVLVLVLIAVLALGSSFVQAQGPEKLRVAMILAVPVGDAGWGLSHLVGLKYLEARVPNVEVAYTESVPETAEAERVLTEYARRGYKLLIAGSFGYMDSTLAVAKRFPEVVIINCCQFRLAPNVATYYVKDYEAGYLVGIIAGKMTKTNIIGYVAHMPTPNVILNTNGFALGVRSVNPNAKIHLVWTQAWYNPAKEREGAESVMDVGADIVAENTDSPAPVQAAERRGKFSIGVYTDMSTFGPKGNLTSAVWNWGPIFVDVAQRVRAGTFKSTNYLWGLKEGGVTLAPFGRPVPADVRQLVTERKQALIDGSLFIFKGPIRDQSGTLRVPAGKVLTHQEAWSLGFLVEGIVGTLPR